MEHRRWASLAAEGSLKSSDGDLRRAGLPCASSLKKPLGADRDTIAISAAFRDDEARCKQR
jgi:hypothetical protein